MIPISGDILCLFLTDPNGYQEIIFPLLHVKPFCSELVIGHNQITHLSGACEARSTWLDQSKSCIKWIPNQLYSF